MILSSVTWNITNHLDPFEISDSRTITLGGGPHVRNGNGSPECVISAPVGSMYLRKDGGAGTSHYIKESGTGNTGWVVK